MLALPVKVPADAIALWRWGTEIDVRDILPAIHVPTLVLQRTGDRWVKPEEGRYLATHIEGARYVELAGRDHVIWGEDCDGLIDKIRDFVIGAPPPARAERVLISVLALAIDGAADDAKAARQADIVRDGLLLGGGTEIRRSRDTLLAAFQRPTRSIECAMAIANRLGPCGLKVRAAIHIGECEARGEDFSGIAIEVTARLLDHAQPGQIIASRTMRDLAVGSGLTFEEQGEMKASGLPGALQYFAVTGAPPGL